MPNPAGRSPRVRWLEFSTLHMACQWEILPFPENLGSGEIELAIRCRQGSLGSD